MSKFPDRFTITSDFSSLEDKVLDGSRVSVGFRPSGELHIGNLLSITYAAVIAERLGMELDLFCCDTDWSAPILEQNKPGNSDVMKLFYNRDCPCSSHANLPEHRVDEIEPFLRGLRQESGLKFESGFLTELTGGRDYTRALRKILENMEEFDSFFDGAFRHRYRSPVATFCHECGFSHAKGCDYSVDSDELVASCRNQDCTSSFMNGKLSEKIGVHYLVDPVRDPSRDVAKVAKITELATGENPAYFLGPMISDSEGKPLSKSSGTGKTVSEIDDLESYGRELYRKVENWIEDEKKYLKSSEL